MDFADARLMCPANESKVLNIVTLEHRYFSLYRTSDNQTCTIFPEVGGP